MKSVSGGTEGAERWKEVAVWEAGSLEDSKDERRLNNYVADPCHQQQQRILGLM